MNNLLQLVDSLEMNELHRAVQENCLEGVKFLVCRGADVMNTINEGQTPLYIAIENDYQDIAEELCKHQSRDALRNLINRRTVDTGRAALHLAARNNSLVSASYLLSHGANFEIRDKENRSPKDLTTDKRIVELIDSIEDLRDSILANDGKIFLDKLNSLCRVENVEVLMYARDRRGCTALQLAMEKNRLDAVAAIVDFRIKGWKQWQTGVNLDKLMQHSKAARLHLSNLDAFFYEDDDLAIDACIKKEVLGLLRSAYDFLESYREQGDPNFENHPSLVIIEQSLQYFGSWKMSTFIENTRVDSMLRKGLAFAIQLLKLCIVAPIQMFMRSAYSMELVEAAKNNDMKLVEKCLLGQPDFNRGGPAGETALYHAFFNSNDHMAKLLLNLGADPSRISGLLHLAMYGKSSYARNINTDVMQVLLDRVNNDKVAEYINDRNSEAFHLAVTQRNFQLVELLLSKGSICRMNCAFDHHASPHRFSRTAFDDISELLKSIDRLFKKALEGKVEELVQAMRRLHGNTLLAVGGARNDQGYTLDQVVDLQGHADEAEQIRQLLANKKWRKR